VNQTLPSAVRGTKGGYANNASRLALLIGIRTEPAHRECPDRNERRGRILDVFDRGVRRRAGHAAATATGEFQSVVLGVRVGQHPGHAGGGSPISVANPLGRLAPVHRRYIGARSGCR
jgi:hypothetical protein